jgi:glucokinase
VTAEVDAGGTDTETGAFDVVCDIGGTNIRFAKSAASSGIGATSAYPLSAFPSFTEAFARFQADVLADATPRAIAVGAAGPVRDGQVQMTNAAWTIREAELAALSGGGRAVLVNDLQAMARAIPELNEDELHPLVGTPRPAAAIGTALAVNVGTGFGASALHRLSGPVLGKTDPMWIATATEAGHMRDAAAVASGAAEALTFEDAISGSALAQMAERDGLASAGDVFDPARNPGAAEALAAFSGRLGGALCDLVLAHGAWDGVYLVGSVAVAWAYALNAAPDASGDRARSAFHEALHRPGKMNAEVVRVPVSVVAAPDPALLGLRALLGDRIGAL